MEAQESSSFPGNILMKHTLLTVDNFSPDLARIRQEVINQGFDSETGPDGLQYEGINKTQYPELIAAVEAALEKKIIPRLACFRLNLAKDKLHSLIHADTICARYAAVLYMNLPMHTRGGTAFWTHTGLGIDQVPTAEEIHGCGMSVKWFLEHLRMDWDNLAHWVQTGFVGMKFNRFVTYPTNMFHSRYPFEAFGETAETGRLIWVCFYDLEGEEPAKVVTA